MEILGKLSTGEYVVDRHNSFYHPAVEALLPALFEKIKGHPSKDFISQEINMGEIIGESICVQTSETDEIVYAVRRNRKGHTRFVKNRQSIPTSKAVVILKWDDEECCYILITAFIGSKSEPEPWDRNATPESRPFWDCHALIFDGSYELVPGTETTLCPWR